MNLKWWHYFLIIFIILTSLVCVESVFQDLFINDKKDSSNLTYIFIPILLAFSGLCFSWSSTLDKEKYCQLSLKLSKVGADSLIAGIVFLAGAFAKYTFIQKTTLLFVNDINENLTHFLIGITYLICFAIALYMTILIVLKILKYYVEFKSI